MKSGRVLAGLAVSCLAGLFSCSGALEEDAAPPVEAAPVTAPYFGQPTPGATPERFAPGVVSTDEIELNGAFTPDGKYLFFSRRWGATWEETTAGDVYWVDARVLDRFRQTPD